MSSVKKTKVSFLVVFHLIFFYFKELEDIYSLYYEKMATNNYEKMSKNHSLSQYNDDPEYKPPSYTQSDRSFYNNDQNAYYD